MKLNMYSVYDATAQLFSQPFFVVNDDVAKRVMKNCVNNPEHNYGMNPTDYHLYRIGEFDDNEGLITGEQYKMFCLESLRREVNEDE